MRIGDYEVLELPKVSGTGEVMAARRPGSTTPLVLHLEREDEGLAEDPLIVRTCRALVGLRHPGLQPLVDVGVHERRVFTVYEAQPGRTLAALWQARGRAPFSGAAATALSLPLCEALAVVAARNPGFVFGDLRFSRVEVTSKGEGCLLEVARGCLDRGGAARANVVGMVRVVLPQFLSPEAARGLRLDARADVFAVGAVLYTLVSGASPLPTEDSFALLQRLVAPEPLPAVATVAPGLSPELCAVIDRALRKDREARFPDAAALAAALAALPRAPEPLPSFLQAPLEVPPADAVVTQGAQVSPVPGVLVTACAMRWEDLQPRPPVQGYEARHCDRCDQAVVRASTTVDAVPLALVGRCLALSPPPLGLFASLRNRLLRRVRKT